VNKSFSVLYVLLFLLHVSFCRVCNYFCVLIDCMTNIVVKIFRVHLYTDRVVTIIVRTVLTIDLYAILSLS